MYNTFGMRPDENGLPGGMGAVYMGDNWAPCGGLLNFPASGGERWRWHLAPNALYRLPFLVLLFPCCCSWALLPPPCHYPSSWSGCFWCLPTHWLWPKITIEFRIICISPRCLGHNGPIALNTKHRCA